MKQFGSARVPVSHWAVLTRVLHITTLSVFWNSRCASQLQMKFHGKIPGAPIPANKGRQAPSLSSPSSIAGFALLATKSSGEHHTLSIADESLATHAALSFFPPSHRQNLIRSQLKELIQDTGHHTARFIAVTITVIPSAAFNGGHDWIDSVTTAGCKTHSKQFSRGNSGTIHSKRMLDSELCLAIWDTTI